MHTFLISYAPFLVIIAAIATSFWLASKDERAWKEELDD